MADQAADQKSDHQQNGRNRPMDERRGYVHGMGACCALCAMASCAAWPCSIVTRVPGCSLYCPSTTTCSLALSPESMRAWPLLICATLTGRLSTVLLLGSTT